MRADWPRNRDGDELRASAGRAKRRRGGSFIGERWTALFEAVIRFPVERKRGEAEAERG